VHLGGRGENPAQEQDDLAHRQFGDRARVGVGIVEDRNAAFAGGRAVNLVDADAERAHRDQFGRGFDHGFGNVRFRAHAENRRVTDLFDQLTLVERGLVRFDGVSGVAELRDGHGADVLEQKNVQGPSRGNGTKDYRRGERKQARKL
jgi:hypothetical protein